MFVHAGAAFEFTRAQAEMAGKSSAEVAEVGVTELLAGMADVGFAGSNQLPGTAHTSGLVAGAHGLAEQLAKTLFEMEAVEAAGSRQFFGGQRFGQVGQQQSPRLLKPSPAGGRQGRI